MRVGGVLAALVLSLAAAPGALAASATLTSPPNGATYYTGSEVSAAVPWSGTFDYSPCSGSNFYSGQVQRWDGPSTPMGTWPSNGGSTTGSISGTNNLGVGVYRFRAATFCGFDTVYSPVATIHVVAGNPPPGGGGSGGLDAQLRAVCAKERALIGELARLARRQRETLPVLDYVERFASGSAIAVDGAGTLAGKTFTTRPFAKVLKLEGAILKFEGKVAKAMSKDMRSQIARSEREIGESLASYRKTCAAFEAPDTSGAGAAKLKVPGTKVPAGRVSAARLRARAEAQRTAYRRFASAGDDGAARRHGRKLAGLIEDNIGARIALARPGLLHHARLATRDLPKGVRGQGWTSRYVGKTVSKLLTDPSLAKAERRLIAVFRAQPFS